MKANFQKRGESRSALSDSQLGRLKELFEEGLDLPSESRDSFIRDATGDDDVLRSELASLLAAFEASDGYFEKLSRDVVAPAVEAIATSDPYGSPDAGSRVSHYDLVERIGGGGMGIVYKARDTRLDRTVALKFLSLRHASSPAARARLLAEAKAASALDHPNIGVVYDVGETESGRQFIAMAWYDGETLKEKLRRAPLAVPDAVSVVTQLGSALAAAHSAGIIHRDVKPANVIVTRSGIAKLVDFGIAKLMSAEVEDATVGAGTVAYMSPEQTLGRTLDPRTDIWSLGVLLYETLTGRRPFKGDTEIDVISAIRNEEPDTLSILRPDVPPRLAEVVERCLNKDPEDRYSTAEELCEALKSSAIDVATGGDSVPVTNRTQVERSFARDNRVIVAAALVVIVVAASAMWGYSRYGDTGSVAGIPASRIVSVAVLPFTDSSGGDSGSYLGDGLSEDLRAELARIGGLTVPTHVASAAYAGTAKSIVQTATEMGVNFVVTGDVRRANDDVTVQLSLDNGKTGQNVWSRTYGTSGSSVGSITNAATKEVLQAVGVKLTQAESERMRRAPAHNARAYDLYLRGRVAELSSVPRLMVSPVSVDKMRRAQATYVQARALDPQFGRLRGRLALTHMFSATTYDTTRARKEQARLEAEIALTLDSQLVEPREALAAYWASVGNRPRAIDELRNGLRHAPNNVDLVLALGSQLQLDGRWDESVAQFERAMRLDPRNPRAAWLTATTYGRMRRNEEGMRVFDRLLEITPADHEVRLIKGQSYLRWKGSTEVLVDALKRIPAQWDNRGMATFARYTVLHTERRDREALAMLDSSKSNLSRDGLIYQPKSLMRAEVHHALGDSQMAHRHYEMAVREMRDSSRAWPKDPSIHAALGLGYAGLGRKREAIAEAEEAMELVRLRVNSRSATAMMGLAVEIFARVGEHDRAFEMIELLLSMPSGREITLPFLRVWPGFDPLRNDARFEALLARFAAS